EDVVELRLRDNPDGLDWILPQLSCNPLGPRPKCHAKGRPRPSLRRAVNRGYRRSERLQSEDQPRRETRMFDPTASSLDRRRFLGSASASAALAGSVAAAGSADTPAQPAQPDGRPPVTNPRATSGDTKCGPKWDEMFALTVGNGTGDMAGTDQRVIQAA